MTVMLDKHCNVLYIERIWNWTMKVKVDMMKKKIEEWIKNEFAETHVGYHREYRMWNGFWYRGCYAQIAEPYGRTIRIYAASYDELYERILNDIQS